MKKLICIIFLSSSMFAQSRIRWVHMGERLKDSNLIVLVDTFNKDEIKRIRIKKILKGNKNFSHKTIKIKKVQKKPNQDCIETDDEDKVCLERIVSTSATIHFPWNEKNIILLSDSWKDLLREETNWDYTEKNDIRSVIKMLKVYKIKNERHRFKAFFKQSLKRDEYFQEQLSDEIDTMTNPKNFDLLINFYNKTNAENQRDLIEKFGEINDLRAVPVLISALSSKYDDVKNEASHTLFYRFPGAKGVTEAFIKYKDDEKINNYAYEYLKKRYKNIDLVSQNKPHPWNIAKQLIKNNEIKKAKDIYKKFIGDANHKKSDKIYSTELFLKIANQEDKLFILKYIVPTLEAEVINNTSYNVERVIKIVRKLNNEKLLPILLKGLLLPTTHSDNTMINIVFAIEDLGRGAKKQAVDIILSVFENRKPSDISSNQDYLFITALAWLNVENDFQPYEKLFLPHIVKSLGLLKTKNQYSSEELFLNSVLKSFGNLKTQIEVIMERWVLVKMSEKKDMENISVLINKLVNSPSDYPYEISQTLSKIGNHHVSDEVFKLLNSENPNTRREATDIFAKSLKEESTSVLVKMLENDDYGNKSTAITYLGIYGNAAHLELLKPFCDFWDKSKYTWKACGAMVRIRDKYNYDLNGPIVIDTTMKHS